MLRFIKRTPFCFLPVLLLIYCACASNVQAQCKESAIPNGQYYVNSVRLNTLFGSTPQKLKDILGKHRGESYHETEQSFVLYNKQNFQGTSRDAFQKEAQVFFESEEDLLRKDAAYGFNQQEGLIIRTKFSTTCVTIVPEDDCRKALGEDKSKCVDVVIKYRAVPINTSSPSSNLLELARSNQLRFYRELPRPLHAFNPKLWIEQDQNYGSSATGQITTDLLNLTPVFRKKPKEVDKTQLRFDLSARKSLSKPFYNAASILSLSQTVDSKTLQKVDFNAGFLVEKTPQGDGAIYKRALKLGISAQFKFDQSFIEQINLGANYRRVTNRFFVPGKLVEHSAENIFALRAISEGKLGNGFYRAGVWFERALPDNNYKSYNRLAFRSGYSGNVFINSDKCRIEKINGSDACVVPKKNTGSIGIETEFGIGKIWGNAPEYARFFGGNTSGSFLYDSPDKPIITDFPSNPLIRSFGQNKAGAVEYLTSSAVLGGTSYWHFNLSTSLPIRNWSRPLIPAEIVIVNQPTDSLLSCNDCTSLKDLLKNQVAGGKNVLVDTLAYRKLTDQQRADLALDPDEDLSSEERRRYDEANTAFENARGEVMPEAERVWNLLTPVVNYIADRANLYSVKPLILFDAANISSSESIGARTRLAVGGGLQFNVVVAKFETGYMRTIRRLPSDSRGNFFVRMIFEKLF